MTMGKRGSLTDGDATRAHLVQTAERLFAEQGIGAVSIRTINKEAGLAAAAVHYHFGSKDGILDAVLRRLGDPVLAQSQASMEALAARQEAPTAREIISAWTAPIIDCLEEDLVRGSRWLLVTTHISPQKNSELWGAHGEVWGEALERAFPAVDPVVRRRGWAVAAVALPHLLARAPGGESAAERRRRRDYIQFCVDFIAFGLEASMQNAAQETARP